MELGGWACASAYSPKQSKTPFLLRSVAASLLPSWQKSHIFACTGLQPRHKPSPPVTGPIRPYAHMITSYKSQICAFIYVTSWGYS